MKWPQPMFAQKKWIRFQALLGDIQPEGGGGRERKWLAIPSPLPPKKKIEDLLFLYLGLIRRKQQVVRDSPNTIKKKARCMT